jgi:DNA polymerase-3 subunit epsilon
MIFSNFTRMYAIVDIETTGGSHKHEKITEIAVYVHDGNKVVKEFTSLINPERNIPYFITGLTGITNEMVADAPKFYEIAKQLVEIMENCIFVAHNVNFDYHFVREEFARLGYDFKREQLCTVKMSRKFIPGKRSYSLGNLCQDLGIVVNDRHRASGDALATVKLFELLLSINGGSLKGSSNLVELSQKNIHPDFDTSLVAKLPHLTGIYRFLNEKGDIIYIGKSNDIHDRVMSHFNNTTTKKALEMKGQIVDIGYEVTGSELVALLLESFEIKKHKPLYNRAQRRTMDHFGIISYTDNLGYVRFFIGKNNVHESLPLASFNNQTEARLFLTEMVERYELCQKLCGLYNSQEACFQYQIGACHGACIGKESPESYNRRADQFIGYLRFDNESFWIIGHGRDADEQSVVRVKNGKYLGFGFIATDVAVSNKEILADCIKSYPDNREIQQIIRNYLKNHPFAKVVKD